MKSFYQSLILSLLFIFFSGKNGFAQIMPAENDTLNYRLVGFSVAVEKSSYDCLFEVAEGRVNNEFFFKKNTILSVKDTTGRNRVIITLPSFGKEYTWRVSFLNKRNKVKGHTPLHHFTIGHIRFLDTNSFRIMVITNTNLYKGMYFFLDNPSVMYDMDGNPLWYLPPIPGIDSTDSRSVRDLKPTLQGTLSCLTEKGAYEVDYNGKIIWHAPDNGLISGDSSEHYHHQLTKLSNNHYLIAGTKNENALLNIDDTGMLKRDQDVVNINGAYYKNTPFGTLIEYDTTGKIVWHWYSSTYFKTHLMLTKIFRNEVHTSTHLNAFYFNEKDSSIYLSFKFISTILKIKYPSGEVLATYSNEGILPDGKTGNLFNYQHNCQLSPDGYLYIFNNNMDRGFNGISYVSMFKEPDDPGLPLSKIWEFPCDIDSFANKGASVGGSVYQLGDKSIFTCMGTAGRVFIVSPEKKVLWNAVPQMHIENEWRPLRQYRASIIENSNELENLIFHK